MERKLENMDENQRPTIEVAPRTSSLAMYKALIKKEEEKEGDNNMRDEEEEEEVAAEDVIRNTSDPLPPLPVHALAGVDSTADSNDPIAAAAAVVVVVVEEERNGEETVVHEHFESAQKLVRDLLLFRESISQVRRDNQLLFHLNRLLILRYLQKQAIQRAMKSVDEERLATNTAFCLHASALDALDKNKEEEETILFSYLDKIQESRSLVKELHLSTKEIDRLKCDQKKQTNPVTSTIPASSSPSSSSLSSAIALLSSHHSPAAQSPTSFKHLLNLVITSNTPSPSSLLTPLESKTLCLANASHFKHRFLTLATNVHTHLAHLIAKRAALTRAIEKCLEHAEVRKEFWNWELITALTPFSPCRKTNDGWFSRRQTTMTIRLTS